MGVLVVFLGGQGIQTNVSDHFGVGFACGIKPY